MKLEMYFHDLHDTADIEEASNKDEKYNVISITNMVIEDLYKKNFPFNSACVQCKVVFIPASIGVCDNNLLLEIFCPIVSDNYELSNND